jgi:hypothetical protein
MTRPGIGLFIKSEWTAPNGTIFEMQHRWEDQALIIDTVRTHGAKIEFGTAKGGFAALLADTLPEAKIVTVNHQPEPGVREALATAYGERMNVLTLDLLGSDDTALGPLFSVLTGYTDIGRMLHRHRIDPPTRDDWKICLYCDNGNKVEEITRFAPLLKPGDLLGCHDYATEVPPEWVEPFLVHLGFVPHRHAEFAALAHPEFYPASLTRFWLRT